MKLTGAIKDIDHGDIDEASQKMLSARDQLDALVQSGRLSPVDAAPLGALLTRIIESLLR